MSNQGLGSYNNISNVSYKSIQKQFESDGMGKVKNEQDKQANTNFSQKPQ